MRVKTNIDKSLIIAGTLKQEEGQMITTYEPYESKIIRKSVCNCKNFIYEGRIAECKLYDDNNNVVKQLMLPNEVIWSCFREGIGIHVAQDGKKIYLPCRWLKSPGCVDVETEEIVWEWCSRDFWEMYIYNDVIFSRWLLRPKGGIKVLDIKTGEILREVMKYNTERHHPYINRLNEQYLIIYSEGGVFLLDMHTGKIYMSKKLFREFMTQDAECVNLTNVENNDGNLTFTFVNIGYGRVYATDPLGWEKKEITVPIKEIIDGIKESPLGIKIPTTKAGVERAYKKLFT